MTIPDDIAHNLARIRARIAEATARANRPAGAVTLVAVSKTHPAAAVEAALAAGQRSFGENRVQEAAGKFPALRPAWPDLRLHVIGALQTNKARDAVRLADVIESLDRPKLAVALAEAMAKEGRRPDCLVQVNVGEEPQKAGILPGDTDAFLRDLPRHWPAGHRPDVHPARRGRPAAAFRLAGGARRRSTGCRWSRWA